MNVLGVILARAGSRGLADKHLLPLLDRPVIAYTFDHARESRRLGRVVVSTDCPRIRALAQREGFATIARPDELATSDASVQAAMLHALHVIESTSTFHADALAVTTGTLVRVAVDVLRVQTDQLQQRLDAPVPVALRGYLGVNVERLTDDVADRHSRVE